MHQATYCRHLRTGELNPVSAGTLFATVEERQKDYCYEVDRVESQVSIARLTPDCELRDAWTGRKKST